MIFGQLEALQMRAQKSVRLRGGQACFRLLAAKTHDCSLPNGAKSRSDHSYAPSAGRVLVAALKLRSFRGIRCADRGRVAAG